MTGAVVGRIGLPRRRDCLPICRPYGFRLKTRRRVRLPIVTNCQWPRRKTYAPLQLRLSPERPGPLPRQRAQQLETAGQPDPGVSQGELKEPGWHCEPGAEPRR
jgi:hypothetical protein